MASTNAAAGAPLQAVPPIVATNAAGGVLPPADTASGAPLPQLSSCRQLIDRGPNGCIVETRDLAFVSDGRRRIRRGRPFWRRPYRE